MQKIKTGDIVTARLQAQPRTGRASKKITTNEMRFFVISHNKEERSYVVLKLMLPSSITTNVLTFTLRDKGIIQVLEQTTAPSDLEKWNTLDAYVFMAYEVAVGRTLTSATPPDLKEVTLQGLRVFATAVRELGCANNHQNLRWALEKRKSYFRARQTPTQMKSLSRSVRRKLSKKQKMRTSTRSSARRNTAYVTPNLSRKRQHSATSLGKKVTTRAPKIKPLPYIKYVPTAIKKVKIPF